ncbi:MAG TPA: hypothetical protein PL110_19900 [Candidatus Eremiobacteraeota bacterium]|nr:hypothetical protein [Candidatus Eremiobacteraeota bacterium]
MRRETGGPVGANPCVHPSLESSPPYSSLITHHASRITHHPLRKLLRFSGE